MVRCIYIDYTDLKRVCPKDAYPLPSIDQLIDATAGHLLLSFIDVFLGYHQIKMAQEDIPKTAFITYQAVYAFKAMSFGLVNTGATYQRIMNTVFKEQIGKNMEVYVDDIIVKSLAPTDRVKDLQQCFQSLRRHI